MNFRTTYILFGGLGIVLAVVLLVQLFGKKTSTDTSNYALPSMHKPSLIRSEDIDKVEIRRPEESMMLVRTKHGWKAEKPNVRVDSMLVDRLIGQVRDAARDETAETRGNLSQYGLDSPTYSVTLHHKDNRQWTFNLGKVGVGGIQKGVVYASSSDRPSEALAIKGSQLDHVYKKSTELRDRALLSDNSTNVSYVRLDETGKEPVIIEQAGDRDWKFQKPPYGETDFAGETSPAGREETKITGVDGLLKTIAKLKVEGDADFVEADATDLAKYGLEDGKPEKMRIEIERKAGGGLLGGSDSEKIHDTLLIGKRDGAKYYARLGDDRAVVRISAANVDAISAVAADPAILRNRDLVRSRPAEIDAIDVKNAGGLIKIRGTEAKRKLLVGDAKPRNADDRTVGDLLGALSQPRQVQSFPDPAKEKEYGFDKPNAPVVSLWVNGLKKDDKKDDILKKDDKAEEKKDSDTEFTLKEPDKPTWKLTFGNEDKDSVYVLREKGGDKSILAVPKGILTKINQGPLAYFERTIPSFSETAAVTKLLIERSGEPVEIEKDDQVWKFKQPKDLAGRTADKFKVDALLAELRGLRPERFEAEGMVDLDKYGLKTPAAKATVTVKGKGDKPEDWIYLFGKETDDKSGVYAKQEKSDLVFVASPRILETLHRDLEDPTVFQFDINKVKELKVTGWRQLTGFDTVLQLERQSANSWSVKQPPGFDVNPQVTERFVAALSNLKADKFVLKKDGPLPDHKLGDKEAALKVEITLDGEKEPLALTVGDIKDKSYFAQISNLPGSVFLLPEEPAAGALSAVNWKEVLKTPRYFSK